MNEQNEVKFTWWGYQHISGSLQAKRFFSRRDLDDAYESPFVRTVVEPFEANGREDALNKIAEIVRNEAGVK